MRGATLQVIQELLRHSMILMTMRYAHLALEISRDVVRLLDGSARGGQRVPKPT
jgi:site-specific recombinase XerD